MKTEEPLQGLITCVNHEMIHLALFFSQLLCFSYF